MLKEGGVSSVMVRKTKIGIRMLKEGSQFRIWDEASLRQSAAELDLARALASRSRPHKTALEPPGSGGQNRTTQTYIVKNLKLLFLNKLNIYYKYRIITINIKIIIIFFSNINVRFAVVGNERRELVCEMCGSRQ